jgi:hypothetical protein
MSPRLRSSPLGGRPPLKSSSLSWSQRAWNSGVRTRSGVRGRGRSISTTAVMRPGRADMTATPSARKTASLIEWVTSSVVAARSAQMRSNSMLSRWRVISSRAPKGSSSRRISGSTTSERAMATRWRIPPESCAGRACSKPFRPTRETRSAMAASWALIPLISSGSRMLATTERQGRRAASWKAMPRRC